MRTVRIAAVVGLLGFSAGAGAEEEKETKLAVDKLPKAVVAAVKEEFEGAEIKGAETEEDDGETIYEVEISHEGKTLDVTLDEEGEIYEVETEIAVKDLPKPVADALANKYPGAKIEEAEKVVEYGDDEEDAEEKKEGKEEADDEGDEEGETSYEVEIVTADGKTLEVEVSEDGKEIEEESGDDEEEDEEAEKGK